MAKGREDNRKSRIETRFIVPQHLEHGKVPPNAIALEEAVLGAILLEPEWLAETMAILRAEDFYKIEHQRIFEAILELHSDAEKKGERASIDILTVTDRCKTNGVLELVGGPYYISKLTDRVSGGANIEFHSHIVRDKSLKRQQIAFAGMIYEMGYDDQVDALETLDRISMGYEEMAGRFTQKKARNNRVIMQDLTKRMEKGRETKGITGLTTGIQKLDKVYGGRQKGTLIIKAARPAMGKTSAAICEAKHAAFVLDKPVAFFSLEMSDVDLVQRIISEETDIDIEVMKSGELTDEQWTAYNKAWVRFENSKLRIFDGMNDMNEVRAACMQMKAEEGLEEVFIDYLQLMEYGLHNGYAWSNTNDKISAISRSLKRMSRALDIPVVALAQLSREVEKRGDKRPMLSDLRDSGAIEQDADIVEFLYRPEYYGIRELSGYPNTHGLAFTLIAKHRNGKLKDVPMRWDGSKTKFSNWETDLPIPKASGGKSFTEKEEDDAPF